MSDYTPTTNEILATYMRYRGAWNLAKGSEAQFYRWLEQVKAEAWEEGHRTLQDREPDNCQCWARSEDECGCGLFGTGTIITPNPYRQEQGDQDADLNPSNSMGLDEGGSTNE